MCPHLQGAAPQKRLRPSPPNTQTWLVQSDTLMLCPIKGKRDWNHTWHRDTFIIYKRSLQMISSLFPQTPQIARLMRNLSAAESKGKQKKKSAVSNYVQGDKTVSHTQRQLQGCQHSSWYCRTSLWLVPNFPDCHCRSGGCWGTGAECRGVGATSPQFASSLAGAQHTHKVLLKMHVETYFSGRLLIPVKKTLEVFAVNREECIA